MSDETNQMLRARLPIWWDPPPDWMLFKLERDPEFWRQYLEFDAEFVAKELEFQATKVREFSKTFAQIGR